MKTSAEIREDLDTLLDKLFAPVLTTNYLYDTDQKRTKMNMVMLVMVLTVSGFVGSIGAMLEGDIRFSWIQPVVVLALGAAFYYLVTKQKTLKQSSKMITIFVVLSVWAQFIFAQNDSFNPFIFFAYPLLLCFFLGNDKGLTLLLAIGGNLIVCFWIWRKTLMIVQSGALLSQFIISFISISLFAVFIEIIHSKVLLRLTFLTRQITDDSFTDTLTRLLTRRAFNERFARTIEDQAASGKPVFVIMCDIDHFKNVNDTYGHHIGDEVLKHVADILSKYAMGKDLCFRWGGEEFLIFLNEQSLTRAVDAANRIRVVLEYTHFTSPTSGTIKVTMSFGLHQFDSTMSMEKNISVADGYLYAAKQGGRNRVEYAK